LQLASGCLVDQLVGQFLAHICGLGYLGKQKHIRKTVQSIFKYNFKSNFHGHFNHMRSYVLSDESALVMASYPRGNRPKRPFPYFNEVMTGFEYTAAIGLLYEGKRRDGLRCIDAIRKRYDGKKRSPFNEAECGHHYARAMASWAALPALTGFHYSAVEEALTFAATKTSSRVFWSNGYAWGTMAQARDDDGISVELTVLSGSIKIIRFTLTGFGSTSLETGREVVSGHPLQLTIRRFGSAQPGSGPADRPE
jgi:hypothetical protein